MAEIEIKSEIAGKVWLIEAGVGQAVEEEDAVIILESMKMEIEIQAPEAGKISKIRVATGQDVQAGQCLIWLDKESRI